MRGDAHPRHTSGRQALPAGPGPGHPPLGPGPVPAPDPEGFLLQDCRITSELWIAESRVRYDFRTKDDLVGALVVDGFTTLARELRRVLHDSRHRTAEERTAFAVAYRDWAVRHSHHYLLMYSAPAREGSACVVGVFADLVRTCLAGESHGSARTVGVTVHAWPHGVVALALVARDLQDIDHDEVFALEVADLGRLLESGSTP